MTIKLCETCVVLQHFFQTLPAARKHESDVLDLRTSTLVYVFSKILYLAIMRSLLYISWVYIITFPAPIHIVQS